MQTLMLPLVELLVSTYLTVDLRNVKIIGVQHILETTHAMFRSLYKLGLKPENVSLIGKCYSTCREVYEEMRADGIDVSPLSFAYSSHRAFDTEFELAIQEFLAGHLQDLTTGKYEQIIILDDGGKCITFLSQHLKSSLKIAAIEQTSSGYHAIRSIKLPFPVINVARSPLKLELESPMIAQAAAERLLLSLQRKDITPGRALIIGGGAIGKAMKDKLSQFFEVTVFDQKTDLSTVQTTDLVSIIGEFSLIIGCTGQTTITKEMHAHVSPGTTLVSVSSSDREFDSVHLRSLVQENSDCHEDLLIEDVFLVNSGFPVNFDGDRENIAPELIQLTIALITAGILKACKFGCLMENSIHPLSQEDECRIKQEFLQIAPARLDIFSPDFYKK